MSDDLRKAMDSMLADEPPYPADLGDRALRRGRTVQRRRFAAAGTALAVVLAGAIGLPAVLERNTGTLEVAGTGEVRNQPLPRLTLPPAPEPTAAPALRPTTSPGAEAPVTKTPAASPTARAAAVYDSLAATTGLALRRSCTDAARLQEAPQIWEGSQWSFEKTRRPPFEAMRLLHERSDEYGVTAVFLGRDGELATCSSTGNSLGEPWTVYSHRQRYGRQSESVINPDSLTLGGGLACYDGPPLSRDCEQLWVAEQSGVLPTRVTRLTVTFPRSGRTVDAQIRDGVWLLRHVEYVGPGSVTDADRPTVRLYNAEGKLLLSRREPKGVG